MWALDVERFEQVVERLYGGMSAAHYPLAAWGLIVFELTVSVAIWFRKTRVFTSWTIAVAMWLFVLVQLRILLFFPGLDCDCFGKLFSRKPGFLTLAENAVFFILAIWMARLAARKEDSGACNVSNLTFKGWLRP